MHIKCRLVYNDRGGREFCTVDSKYGGRSISAGLI